ncbi:MAG: sugar ABC transporter substrate-binding protein [Candidatus Levybacteria bacterium]|nr:sugar ABC transporter substrate-binding protein [Candidatus Levybacteria bacterium]
MDDKTIFQNPNVSTPNPQPEASGPLDEAPPPIQKSISSQENPFAPPTPEQVVQGGYSESENVYKPTSSEPLGSPPQSRLSFLSLGNIIKVFVGLLALFLIFLLVFKVIPGFFNKSKGEVTISYWGLWEDAPTMQTIISDFERENPDIKIKYSKQDIKQYREKLATRIPNGTGPDIFRFHNTWIPMFKNELLPMSSDVITNKEFANNFYPVAQKDLVKNGAIYGIPLAIDTLSMYVNADLFQAAGIAVPTNWQDFITASRQLTVKEENGRILTAGAALGTYDNITHAPDIVSLLLVQNGASLEDLGSTLKQTSDALSFYTSFATGNANVWDATLDPSILAFAKGSLAMYFGYSWDYFTIRAANPSLNFSVVPVPHLPGQNQTIASYWVEGVSSKSKHQKEAFLFMKYLAQKETEQKLYTAQAKTRLFGEPYARVDLAKSLQSSAIVSPFVLQAKDAVSSFFASDTFDSALNSQMNTYLGNAVRSILNDTSPQTAAETLANGVASVLAQYGK